MTELASPRTRAASDPLAEWCVRNIRLDGRPFRFEGHEYLRAIYDDTAPHVVLSKAAQIGGTTWALLRTFHGCLNGLHAMYLFPTRNDVNDFSRSRVTPLLADNPFLSQLVKDTDTVGLKRLGEANLFFRGMRSTVGIKSAPVDQIVFDELDESTPEAKTVAKERLAHSSYKRIIELSNPSLPDFGVDQEYQASDQRHWTMKCPACGEWTCLEKEFPHKLNEEVRIILPRPDGGYYRACPHCQAELDLSAGEWIADLPGRAIHGYQVSQLYSAKVDPGEILSEYRTARFADRFYNLKIGIPWADLERRLDVPSVLALCSELPMFERATEACYMGVDTGKQLHVVILRPDPVSHAGPRQVIHLAVCQDFSELDGLMQRFRVVRCVIDGLPETHATREFAKRHAGRVFMNFFNESQRGSAKWDDQNRTVAVNRTEALDASRAAVRDREVVLPRCAPIVEEFAQHLSCDAKVLDEDPETGAKRYRYVRTGEDHFSLAFTYAWMALPEARGPSAVVGGGHRRGAGSLKSFDGFVARGAAHGARDRF